MHVSDKVEADNVVDWKSAKEARNNLAFFQVKMSSLYH